MKPLIRVSMTSGEKEERLRALLAPRQAPPGASGAAFADYKGLQIEHPVPYNNTEKTLFHYETSLERLKSAGFQRHLRPAEIFSILVDNLEGKLSGRDAEVAKNMLESYGEWTSMAIKVEGEVIRTYQDPEELFWNGNDYGVTTLRSSEEKGFLRTATVPQKRVLTKTRRVALKPDSYHALPVLHQVAPALVEYLWSKPYDQLPQEIQKNGGLYLPPEGIIRPVGRGYRAATGTSWAATASGRRAGQKNSSIRNEG